MRRLLTSVMLAFISLMPLVASGQETINFNEQWWNSLSNSEQISVIEGIENGYQFGYMNGWDEGGGDIMKRDDKLTSFSHTFGFYQAAITDFYINHPKKSTEYSPASIMQCLSDKPNGSCYLLGK